MGVIGPKKEIEIPNNSCMFSRYIENEKRIVPLASSLLISAVFRIC